MAHKSQTWLSQEIARLESLYAKRVRDLPRANSFRQVLLLATVPARPEMRTLPLRGRKLLEKAVLTRLAELANLRVESLEQAPKAARQALADAILRDAALLEARYAWLHRQVRTEVARRMQDA